ncbi:HAMP domain-containing histidine kinase [bacterium]|nr:HAMP domain-containing histidine kinase [bacterium]
MESAQAKPWASYQLHAPSPLPARLDAASTAHDDSLPNGLLLSNLLWFCRLRWAVVALLVTFGLACRSPGLLSQVGLCAQSAWPFAVAGFLALSNALFWWHGRRLAPQQGERGACLNLWAQIVTDLVVLTVVVHFIGSLETYVAFAYLFHIVLACIVFPRGWSLVVTALACVLYVGCVTAEETGLVSPGGIYANAVLRQQFDQLRGVRMANMGWAIITWSVVWYLASHLSALVRQRDHQLAETNSRLVATQEERRQHMLRTTHELKAPFSAIHANVQLLTKGYCGELPQEAQEVLGRIAARSRRLAAEIQEMLQLANLQSTAQEPPSRQQVDLADLVSGSVAQAQPLAQERQVSIECSLAPARTIGPEDHLRMLLGNLLANAVAYSHPGGRVRVDMITASDGSIEVRIEDQGIGIPADKLAHIFDAYYRTDAAARHNKASTGLGLAIVKQVAETHGLDIRVESKVGTGTRLRVTFPSIPDGMRERKENGHELHSDRG